MRKRDRLREKFVLTMKRARTRDIYYYEVVDRSSCTVASSTSFSRARAAQTNIVRPLVLRGSFVFEPRVLQLDPEREFDVGRRVSHMMKCNPHMIAL